MREIKFRAWHPLNKEMVYPQIVANLLGSITSGDLLNHFSEENIMQFTNLIDINKNDVYEGDIVRFRTGNGGNVSKNRLVEVVAWNTSYGYSAGVYPLSLLYYPEVIGNIYENPELLQENQPITNKQVKN